MEWFVIDSPIKIGIVFGLFGIAIVMIAVGVRRSTGPQTRTGKKRAPLKAAVPGTTAFYAALQENLLSALERERQF